MEETAALPRFCIIQSNSNNRYLQLNTTSDVPNIALQFGGASKVDLYARFEMVPATTGGGLYNIRCMHNNKYLSHLGDGQMWITAIADVPDEDLNSKTCTLFKPVLVLRKKKKKNPVVLNPVSDDKTIRFLHVKTGNYACLWRVGPPFNDCLYTATSLADQSGCDVFTIINCESTDGKENKNDLEKTVAALVADLAGVKESLASEMAEKKALGGKLAVLEADVANLKRKDTVAALVSEIGRVRESLASERAQKKALRERLEVLEFVVPDLAEKVEKCCVSKDESTNNIPPWMSDTNTETSEDNFPPWVRFEDLEVYEIFSNNSHLITVTDAIRAFPRDDDTINIKPILLKAGMSDGDLVCIVADVAGLVPNSELARFDSNVWGLFIKSGTSYAVRRATMFDMPMIPRKTF